MNVYRFTLAMILVAGCALPLGAAGERQVSVRHTSDYREGREDARCAIKVWVDDEAEFVLRDDRLTLVTLRGQEAREVASECNAPLLRNVRNFKFKGIDGRGNVQLVQEPSGSNGWRAVVRIRDSKGGGEEYHFRLTWSGGDLYSGGERFGRGRDDYGRSPTRQRDRDDLDNLPDSNLRRDIEGLYRDVTGRSPSSSVVDEYVNRVRRDRWSLRDVERDMERRNSRSSNR